MNEWKDQLFVELGSSAIPSLFFGLWHNSILAGVFMFGLILCGFLMCAKLR